MQRRGEGMPRGVENQRGEEKLREEEKQRRAETRDDKKRAAKWEKELTVRQTVCVRTINRLWHLFVLGQFANLDLIHIYFILYD